MLDLGAIAIAETRDAAVGVIDNLVRHGEHARPHIGAYAADRIDPEHAPRTEVVQRPDVRAVIDPMRRDRVPARVAREKGHALATDLAERDRIGRCTVRGLDGALFHFFQAWEVVQAGAADDCEFNLHGISYLRVFCHELHG